MVGHGLNLAPQKMEPLCAELAGHGLTVIPIDLTIVDDRGAAYTDILQEWRTRFLDVYRDARALAQRSRAELFFAGYSLSAAVGLDLLSGQPDAFDRTVLLAPAVQTRPCTHLLKLAAMTGINMKIPSCNIREYRQRPYTPLSRYRALFCLVDSIKERLVRIPPSLVFLHPQDELVDYNSSRKFFAALGARVVTVDQKRAQPIKTYNHLIIDEIHLGKPAWEKMTGQIAAFFASDDCNIVES